MRINDVPSRPFQRQIGQIRRKNESQWNGGKTFGSCTTPPVKVSYHTFSQKAIIYHAIHILTIYNRIKVL